MVMDVHPKLVGSAADDSRFLRALHMTQGNKCACDVCVTCLSPKLLLVVGTVASRVCQVIVKPIIIKDALKKILEIKPLVIRWKMQYIANQLEGHLTI